MLVDRSKVVRLQIPHEEESWVEIRTLTGVDLDEAGDAVTTRVVEQFKASLDVIMNATGSRDPNKASDRKSAYDPRVILNKAIAAWSYPEPVTSDNIELLDGQTRDWLWEEVVNRNTRPPESKSR